MGEIQILQFQLCESFQLPRIATSTQNSIHI